MADTIALEKKKQKSVKRNTDNIKKLLKTGKIVVEENVAPAAKKKVLPRGVLYLSNIPHGFYEDEMRNYFSQFGIVTRLRLARSKKTGRSRGFAFVEFKEPEVAKIAAETMDNYLMCKRLLKAKYIAPEEQHGYYFQGKNWTPTRFPKLLNRKNNIKNNHAPVSDKQYNNFVKKCLKQINDVKKKLKTVGIEYDFIPVDIPEHIKIKDDGEFNIITEKSTGENDILNDDESGNEQLVDNDDSESDDDDVSEDMDSEDFELPPVPQILLKKNSVISKNGKVAKKNIIKMEKPKLVEKKLKGITKISKDSKVDMNEKKLRMIKKNIELNDQVQLTTLDDIKKSKRLTGNKTKSLLLNKRKMKKTKK